MKTKTAMIFSSLILILSGSLLAQNKNNDKSFFVRNTVGTPSYTKFNINNISTYIYCNGKNDCYNKEAKFIFPKASNKTAFYFSGLLWGGTVNGSLQVGGSSYLSSLTPGNITSSGEPENPDASNVKIYRVRKDYSRSDLESEILDEGKEYHEIFASYQKDWNEWPVEQGAPFTDIDNNGIYNPSVDIPGVQGADQTIWFVANDYQRNVNFYGSSPTHVLMCSVVWGYNGSSALRNVIFKKYWMINKTENPVNDMYINMYTDVDIGDHNNDFVGCDTTLSLGYGYNASITDEVYGENSPAAGFALLQGPMIEGNINDTAKFCGRDIVGYKNLSLTAFSFFAGDACSWPPDLDDYQTGTLMWFNIFKGYNPWNGNQEHPDFMTPGDPITEYGTINVDGYQKEPGERSMNIVSGPFNLEPGDTQEVIFAQIIAGAKPGVSRLESITLLKDYTRKVKQFYDNNLTDPSIPEPELTSANLDKEIVLYWAEDEIEDFQNQNYFFQGYNVYQLPKAESNIDDGVKIAEFDLTDNVTEYYYDYFESESQEWKDGLVKFGSDNGIERFISIEKDSLTGNELWNGSEYYFAVTSFAFNPDSWGTSHIVESSPAYLTAIPHTANPGFVYSVAHDDSIYVSHLSGIGYGTVSVMIVDPTILNGHTYEIRFSQLGNLTWNLIDITSGNSILIDQDNLNGGDKYSITDGFIVKVICDSTSLFTSNDIFSFTLPESIYDYNQAMLDVEQINVYPNPYYGGVQGTPYNSSGKVTFTHLPTTAIVNIFNLAGQLIRRLDKNDQSQFLIWDLNNVFGNPVSSGLYLAHIQLPTLNKVKVMKLLIVH